MCATRVGGLLPRTEACPTLLGMHLINIRSTPTNSSAPPCKDLHPFARRGDLRAGGGTCILAGAVLVEILACEQGARVHACMCFKGGTGRHCHAVCHGAAQRERHSCSIAPRLTALLGGLQQRSCRQRDSGMPRVGRQRVAGVEGWGCRQHLAAACLSLACINIHAAKCAMQVPRPQTTRQPPLGSGGAARASLTVIQDVQVREPSLRAH